MKMEDKTYLLTHFETVTPFICDEHWMAQCPKCDFAVEVGYQLTICCPRCGMLFRVQGEGK